MSNKTKIYWTTQQVYNYLKNKTGKLELPNDVYFSEDFKWNEVLKTNDKFFQMPSMEILENLKVLFNVVQKYRSFIGREFTINSSWRSPAEQKDLIEQYNKGKLETKPSETSLHMEGLAVDITVKGSQKDFQKLVNDTFVGEAEFGWNYTHLALTTFSKSYLEGHGLFRDDIYRKLVIDTTKLPKVQRDYIEKRMDPATWKRLDTTFDPIKNKEMFSELNQTDNCDLNNKNLEEDTLFSIKPNSLPKYFDIDKLIDKKVEDSVKVQKGKTTGFAADLSEDSSSYDSGIQSPIYIDDTSQKKKSQKKSKQEIEAENVVNKFLEYRKNKEANNNNENSSENKFDKLFDFIGFSLAQSAESITPFMPSQYDPFAEIVHKATVIAQAAGDYKEHSLADTIHEISSMAVNNNSNPEVINLPTNNSSSDITPLFKENLKSEILDELSSRNLFSMREQVENIMKDVFDDVIYTRGYKHN